MTDNKAARQTAARVVDRDRLLAFLMDPASYPHQPRVVTLVETHTASVFLAGPFVYKVKKPVNFGFLDFSTLEKRRHFSQRTVELNQRLCPHVYLGVIPISTRKGRLVFGEGDAVVEYAVKMRKLGKRYFLDRLLQRGEVGRKDLDRIVATLRDFYEDQTPNDEIESWGRVERLKISTDENFEQAERFVGGTITRAAFDTIRFYTDAFYARHEELFRSRIRDRRIRDCHGDLHLDHIHLTPRTLQIYDCIEFNDRLRYVDVASDVAFLAMDLDYRGHAEMARYLVERMRVSMKDPGMVGLMDFYKCYRAFVRGKVESLHGASAGMTGPEKDECVERGCRHFRLALQYAVTGSRPTVLVVMGRPASGKSSLARALAGELNWAMVSSDAVRKELAGVPLCERGTASVRSRLYSAVSTRRTYGALLDRAVESVAGDRSVILDATFGRASHRVQLRKRLAKTAARVRFIELTSGKEVVEARLSAREGRSDEVSDARLEDYERLAGMYEDPAELDSGEHVELDAEGPVAVVCVNALKALCRRNVVVN